MRCFRPFLVIAAAVVLLPLGILHAGAAEEERLTVELLDRDLGDPRAPSNLKIAVELPDSLVHRLPTVRAEDFSVRVFPDDSGPDGLADESNVAGGVYLWRSGQTVFLDVRQVPLQDKEGEATVVVEYHPDNGPVIAGGTAEATCTYATQLVDVFLAIDISSSMNHTDPKRRRVVAARTFIEMAREGGGIGRVGLITFNSRARLNTPLLPLDQGENLLNALRRVGANGLTSLDAPLRMGLEQFAESGDSARPVMILLTDGRNEGSRYRDAHLACAEAGVRLYTIGLTELADHTLLKVMAEATGGMYFRAPSDEDLPEIYARLAAELGKRRILRTEMLFESAGEVTIPIDASIRRLAAISDSGARVRVTRPDGTSHAGGRFSNVHMMSPVRGDWKFEWMDAEPGDSHLSLSGDSQFFLDLFPAQYRPGKIAIGATLAEGERPLGGARVWLEPVPGVFDEQVELFDDGRHGDGDANDGVYGFVADITEDATEQFIMIVRAGGAAWDYGSFVRQATSLAVQMPDPPVEGTVSLEGDLDFGVVFPGETGTAIATMELDAKIPREMHFDLLWNRTEQGWPDLSSSLVIEPGRHAFELEMTVPVSAVSGQYEGIFSITDRGIIHDDSVARIRVGTVRFARGGIVDLGIVPPGTFSSARLGLPYDADKAARISIEAEGDPALTITSELESVEPGQGEIPLEFMVSVPLRTLKGEFEALVKVRAGPGSVDLRVRWQVKEYSAPEAEEGAPIAGLPEVPDLPRSNDFLPPPDTADLSVPDSTPSLDVDRPDVSPWEKAERALRGHPEPMPAVDPSVLRDLRFPDPVRDEVGGSSFWSAWWVYLLAILLLLLLLLLLIVYILYRLGKSALARFLLVSGIANLILLAAFIALLGTASGARSESQRIAVTLVEDAYEPVGAFSDAEMGMLGAASSSGTGTGVGTMKPVGEITFDSPSSQASGILAVRSVELPDAGSIEVAIATTRQPSAMPLDTPDNQPLRRRDHRTERPERPMPEHALPEITEPPIAPAEYTGTHSDIGEMRLQLEVPDENDRPAWSDGERVAQPLEITAGLATPEPAGVEAVALDTESRRIDPRGKRRIVRNRTEVTPEPRSDVFDPARDREQTIPDEPAEHERADHGVEEIRPEPPASGETLAGERPGTIILPGIAMIAAPSGINSGLPGVDPDERVDMRGGARSIRGGERSGSPMPSNGTLPGGAASSQGQPRGSGTAANPDGSQGEMRFDDLPVEGIGTGSGERGRAVAGREPGGLPSSPSLAAGSGNAPRLAFGDVGKGGMDGIAALGERDGARRSGNGTGSSDQPEGSNRLPGGSGGNDQDDGIGQRRSGNGASDNGIDEGRFDEMGDPGDDSATARRPGTGGGLGRSDLGDGGSGAGLGSIPFESAATEWRRNSRRDHRRSVNVAASSLDKDSLLIVVGDFARLPDPASQKLFSVLAQRLGAGLTVEDRRVAPGDETLADCLLSLVTPEEVRDWNDADIRSAADYLASGGHIWMDASRPGQADTFMQRLVQASGGEYGPLPADHQLAAFDPVQAVTVNGQVAAVATAQDWRKDWRYGRSTNGPTLRFLIRSLNYFLSGNAETGIDLESDEISDSVQVQPYTENMPELLAGAPAGDGGRVWDNFGPDGATLWRMPAWSDPGSLAPVSDGQGGRALKLDLGGAIKGRAAVYKTLRTPEDLSNIASMSLDAYHDGAGEAALSLVMTVPAGSGWTDFETRPVRLQPGWNSIVFRLDDGQLRSLADGSGYDRSLIGAERTGRAGFFLYRNAQTPSVLLLRDIRLHE